MERKRKRGKGERGWKEIVKEKRLGNREDFKSSEDQERKEE